MAPPPPPKEEEKVVMLLNPPPLFTVDMSREGPPNPNPANGSNPPTPIPPNGFMNPENGLAVIMGMVGLTISVE